MKSNILGVFLLIVSLNPLLAGTVVISSLADPGNGLAPLAFLGGVPLTQQSQIRVGCFPGMNDDEILDLASQGGLTQVVAGFVPFGNPGTIGQGANGAAGEFEIAVSDPGATPAWDGETVTLLIKTADQAEYLVARFPGSVFEADSETGLGQLLALHLRDAKIIVGNRTRGTRITTASSPTVGSFLTWLSGFPSITDPLMKLPDADPDSDGLSNFLEYATGGNPALGGDGQPCWIQKDTEGALWIHFKRIAGLGSVNYDIQQSGDLKAAWTGAVGEIEADAENANLMKMQLPNPLGTSGFFRLLLEPAP